ncbi:MAG: hypothetical protein J5769_02935 [Bacteroidales bacterium]|nr:hypothetical protein [Bacteroidales bacterium]
MRKKSDNISHGKPSAGINPLKASQSSDSAKVRTKVEITKNKLRNLGEKWKGVNSVYGFLSDLWSALGMTNDTKSKKKGGNPSRYATFEIKKNVIVTIRASAHNADASNYSIEGNKCGDCNLSIVLRKRNFKSTFKSNVHVELDEYVYIDSKIASITNPLTQISLSLINYLTNGVYIDTTGVAIHHKSPSKDTEPTL